MSDSLFENSAGKLTCVVAGERSPRDIDNFLPCTVLGRWSHGKSFVQNVVRGVGSVVVLMPTQRSWCFGETILQHSDEEMIRDDWYTIGDDLRNALDHYREDLVVHGEPV